jgi:hypothetical protein
MQLAAEDPVPGESTLRTAIGWSWAGAHEEAGIALAESHAEDVLHRLLGPGRYRRLLADDQALAERLPTSFSWRTKPALMDLVKLLKPVQPTPPPAHGSGRGGAPSWDEHFARLTAFYRANGHLCPQSHVEPDGMRLGAWLRNQRNAVRGHRPITDERRRKLDRLCPNWMTPASALPPD